MEGSDQDAAYVIDATGQPIGFVSNAAYLTSIDRDPGHPKQSDPSKWWVRPWKTIGYWGDAYRGPFNSPEEAAASLGGFVEDLASWRKRCAWVPLCLSK